MLLVFELRQPRDTIGGSEGNALRYTSGINLLASIGSRYVTNSDTLRESPVGLSMAARSPRNAPGKLNLTQMISAERCHT